MFRTFLSTKKPALGAGYRAKCSLKSFDYNFEVYSNPVYELFKYFPTHSNYTTFLKFKTMAKNNKNVRNDSPCIYVSDFCVLVTPKRTH